MTEALFCRVYNNAPVTQPYNFFLYHECSHSQTKIANDGAPDEAKSDVGSIYHAFLHRPNSHACICKHTHSSASDSVKIASQIQHDSVP